MQPADGKGSSVHDESERTVNIILILSCCINRSWKWPNCPLSIRNYNYGACGAAINEGILAQPERVAQDATIAFKTAIWFWSTQQWNKPSCHAVMTGSWSPSSADNAANRRPGFGVTINIINGGLECNKNSAEADRRVQYYKKFCSLFGVDPGQNLDCRSQKPFGWSFHEEVITSSSVWRRKRDATLCGHICRTVDSLSISYFYCSEFWADFDFLWLRTVFESEWFVGLDWWDFENI